MTKLQSQMKPSPHPQGDEVSGVHSSWLMVHSNEQSTMNHESGGFHSHPRGDVALPPPVVDNPVRGERLEYVTSLRKLHQQFQEALGTGRQEGSSVGIRRLLDCLSLGGIGMNHTRNFSQPHVANHR